MTTKWPLVKVKEVSTFDRGLTYAKSDEADQSGKVVLRATNIDLGSGKLDLSELKYLRETFGFPNSKIVKPGSLLICTASGSKSHLGKAALIDQDYGFAFGGFMAQLTPASNLDSKYFYFNLVSSSYLGFIQKLTDGSNINNLKFSDLGEFEFPLPPLDEQKRIAAKLDEALGDLDKVTEASKIALDQIDALWTSSLVHEFSQESENPKNYTAGNGSTVSLSDVADFVMGQAPPGSASNFDGDGTVFVKVGEFGSLYPIVREWTTQPLKFAKSGDVLICVVGATVGKLNLAIDCAIGRSVAAIRPKPNFLDQKFLYLYLKTIVTSFRNDSSGTAQGVISQKYLQSIDIPLPTLEEQIQIVAKLDGLMEQIEASRTTKLRAIDEANSLRSSILSAAFAGDL